MHNSHSRSLHHYIIALLFVVIGLLIALIFITVSSEAYSGDLEQVMSEEQKFDDYVSLDQVTTEEILPSDIQVDSLVVEEAVSATAE